MKNIFFGIAILAATLAACNNSNNKQAANENVSKGSVQLKVLADTSTAATAEVKNTSSIKEIITTYLQLKNAFAKDNSKDAATAANSVQGAFKNFDKAALTAQQKKVFEDVTDDANEHAEHIASNSENIVHQREHFVLLSKDVSDLIKTFGNGGQTLYKDFCPMANDGKGATWISEIKDIKNPYLGKAMPTCGSVKETIQ